MLTFIESKGNCTGCSACMAACPVQCIHMSPDEEGFLYPVAGAACIKCNKCEMICPQRKSAVPEGAVSIEQIVYAGVTKDYQTWLHSTSGGAFSEICEAWGDTQTVFFGASWDGFDVHHIGVSKGSIGHICKSKYIASSMDACFAQVKEVLQSGRKVVFVGTPCQVSGLRSFLGKNYDKLLLVDLICHGVGSPKVFRACMNILGEQMLQPIKKYEFRTKRGPHEADYMSKVELEDGKTVYVMEDPYIQLFLSQDCLRPSCGKNCRYRNANRQGDITIADFKGLLCVFPELKGTKRNYSTLVANTPKGAKLIEQKLENTMELRKCNLDVIEKYNPLFCRQTVYSQTRDAFFRSFNEEGEAAIKKKTKPAKITKKSIKRKVFDLLPVQARRILMSIK